ncbi:hypothetical protein Q4530_08110 [Colwellia sp. 1_MG-2023]|uniref:hypothetical protein n=1 Tax=unclassified Colwellia TaxID=196834 RepID=UPI001C08FCC7|nr:MULTISPECIES: hypothetical protein [unclassified Colwellia]MBU2926286.1 hypothetical protein [Colwellia sp. C2M11]MDO6651724.1 hypothetical protein [Colwellia sp. 3_MG-2023]MDO6665365.1 hypothetical protein [Colwellia sp. 2_MG-2023]MDO6689738.1 hypothetical protein [Colwellia sp. 1_MG-2023]
MFKLYIVFVLLLTSLMSIAAPVAETQPEDSILLTVLLKHDQSNSFEEYQKILEEQKFFDKFPPKGVTVVSWYVMMGIGQVVTLEVPAHKLREVNLAVEQSAWKAFTVEFYPTYNLYPVFKDKLKNKAKVAY